MRRSGFYYMQSPSPIRTVLRLHSRLYDSQPEEKQIQYTDYIALVMSSITPIISGITYVRCLVAISLVVSSIMIEYYLYFRFGEPRRWHTETWGIEAKCFSSNETIIEVYGWGFGSSDSFSLIIPINSVIQSLTNIDELWAVLPWQVALAYL